MTEKQILKIPEDYKAPLEKEIIWRLDQLPEKIRETEIEIIDLNNQGKDKTQILKDRGNKIMNLMRKEGKYQEGSQQFAQVFNNRVMMDEMSSKLIKENAEIKLKIQQLKIELNYFLNRFKGAQGIAQRKLAMER